MNAAQAIPDVSEGTVGTKKSTFILRYDGRDYAV